MNDLKPVLKILHRIEQKLDGLIEALAEEIEFEDRPEFDFNGEEAGRARDPDDEL